MRSLLAGPALALVVGCATAAPPVVGDDDIPIDGGAIDARLVDAPPDAPLVRTITLSQTGSMTVQPQSSVACTTTGTGVTRDNSYYRAFRLVDSGVTRPFTPTMVTFTTELAGAGGGQPGQTIQVKLYTLQGAMATANLTQVATAQTFVMNGMIQTVMVPVSAAPLSQDQTLVAEIAVPDGEPIGNVFFVGANMGTETQPGYLRAPLCGLAEPMTFASIGFPNVRLILEVTGTY